MREQVLGSSLQLPDRLPVQIRDFPLLADLQRVERRVTDFEGFGAFRRLKPRVQIGRRRPETSRALCATAGVRPIHTSPNRRSELARMTS